MNPHFKPQNKPCLFPFTLENQVYENKCVRSSMVNENETDFRGFCPTSEPHGNWLEKGNYGYCREKGCEVMPEICLTTHLTNQKPCMLPFTYKGEWVDKCVKHDDTYICPTSNPHTNWLEKRAYGECASTGCERIPESNCPHECQNCKTGGSSDEGKPINSNGICEHFCSEGGYCGNGKAYKSGVDCAGCREESVTICENLKNKVRCGEDVSEIFLSNAKSPDACPSECEKAGDGAKGCCEWQHDWKKCMWNPDVRSKLEPDGIHRSAVMCSNENNENCNEDEGNDAYEGWSDFFARHGSIVNDCKTALSYFQKNIGRNDSELICNETNNELIKASVKGAKESGKSMLKSMESPHVTKLPLVTDQNPAKFDETFGEVCKCTCKKKTRPKISPQMKCCEMRGVPDKCMHACGGRTSTFQSRGNPSCMNYMDVIENCKNGPTLEDCCNQHDVYKESPDCFGALCTNKCEDKPWKFFEKYPKKECEKYLKDVSSCCGDM